MAQSLGTDLHPNVKVQSYGRILRYFYFLHTMLGLQYLTIGILAHVLNYRPLKWAMIIFGYLCVIQLISVLFGYLAVKRMKSLYWFISALTNFIWLILVAITIMVFSLSEADDSFNTEVCLHVAWAIWYPSSFAMFILQWRMLGQLGIYRDSKLNLSQDVFMGNQGGGGIGGVPAGAAAPGLAAAPPGAGGAGGGPPAGGPPSSPGKMPSSPR